MLIDSLFGAHPRPLDVLILFLNSPQLWKVSLVCYGPGQGCGNICQVGIKSKFDINLSNSPTKFDIHF